MTGLYRKALNFRKPAAGADRQSAGAASDAVDGISAEERAQIAGRIDAIISESRSAVSPQSLSYTPKRHGAILPIVSNIAILAVFALAGFIIYRLLNHQEAYIAAGQGTVQGTENQLIAEMRKEAQKQLASRDQAILDAQAKLQSLSQQQSQLKSQSDAAVKAREQQLLADYNQKLSAEKDRLEKQGISTDAQAERLKAYETARRQEIDRQIAAARQQAEADLAARQKSIAVLASQYQGDLATARQQREQIQSTITAQQAAQSASTAQGTPAAGGTPAAPAASQDLARLRQQGEKEQLILDQILAGYARVQDALQRQDYATAQNELGSLRTLVQDPSIMQFPDIQKRAPVELFLIGSLSDLVASRAKAASGSVAAPPVSPDTAAASEASAQLQSISQLVTQGDRLLKAGDLAGARAAYLKAMNVAPSVNQGYSGLENIRTTLDRQGSEEGLNGLQQANLFFQAGNFQASLDRYRGAVGLLLKDQTLASQLTDNVMNAGYHVLAADDLAALSKFRTSAQRRQAAVKRIQDLRKQYQAYSALSAQSLDPAGEQSLANLLQAKIVLRQVLDSDPIRSKYPQLNAQIEQYFTALEEQGKKEGRRAALGDLSAALGMKAPSQPNQDPIGALLDGLEALLSDSGS